MVHTVLEEDTKEYFVSCFAYTVVGLIILVLWC